MGIKPRLCQPIVRVTVDDLVPVDNFYRCLDRAFDLTFVRDLVADQYATGGRPSIDPSSSLNCSWCCFSRVSARSDSSWP